MTWITPSHQDSDFSLPLSFDDKLTIFSEQVLGWQLDVADTCINGGLPEMRHSGFAVLNIVLSYFEMVATFKGLPPHTIKGTKGGMFYAGVLDVFALLCQTDPAVRDAVLRILYVSGRNGLYHEGRIRERIVISADFPQSMIYYSHNQVLAINPHKLVPALKEHFKQYITVLRDPGNTDLRNCFDRNFARMSGADPLVSIAPEKTS